jgi:hypothetical protein
MSDGRNLTRAEARAVARDIVESGMIDEWEARAAAYNEAVAEFQRWIQGVPAFPGRMADRWDFFSGALDISEEIVALLKEEGR